MPGTVAVTGATGFIGRHLVRRLAAEGWRIRVLRHRAAAEEIFAGLPVEAVSGALDDPAGLAPLLRDAQAVVHLAGLVRARSRAEFLRVNARGTASLVEAALRQPRPPHLLLISSLAAREPHLSPYAASKRAAEEALGRAGGALPWTVLRPPVVYGPGDRASLAFFRALARGLAPLPAPEGARLSLIHVDDLGAAVAAVLGAGHSLAGATCEVDDGEPGGYGWEALIGAAAQHLGRRPRRVRVSAPVLHALAYANGLAGLLLGRPALLSPGKAREIRHADWLCRDRLLVERTPWRPQIRVPEGFRRTIAWYRTEKWL